MAGRGKRTSLQYYYRTAIGSS